MSVTVQFSITSKKENSTLIPEMRDSAECTFKNGCSMLKPTLLLNIRTDTFPNYTFFKIENRIYRIRDIRSVRNDLFEIDGEVDVLATYKTQIGASSQYVTRSASSYDLKAMDSKYPTIADVDRGLTPLSDIASGMGLSGGTFPAGTYVLGLKSKDSDTGVAFYAMSPTEFGQFCDYLYSTVWLDATDITVSLQKLLVDPFDYIISCTWYPFTVSGASQPVYFGFWDWTGHNMTRIPESDRIKSVSHTADLPNHPQISRGTYLNASPYTRLTLNLYSFGQCALDPNRFLGSRSVTVLLNIDMFTGIGVCKVLSSTGTVYQASATCGIPIQLSQVKDDLTKPIVDSAKIAGAIAAENVVGVASSIASAVKNAPPQIESVGAVGSVAAYYLNAPVIDSLFYKLVDEDITLFGRPLCKPKVISTLSGYIECENVAIELSAAENEIDKVKSYLKNGFFYE